MKFFDKNPPGGIIARLSKDIGVSDYTLPSNLHSFLEDIALAIGIPIGIAIQFPWMIIFMLISIVLIYFQQIFYRPTNREIKRLHEVNSGIILSHINETCKGAEMIRAF